MAPTPYSDQRRTRAYASVTWQSHSDCHQGWAMSNVAKIRPYLTLFITWLWKDTMSNRWIIYNWVIFIHFPWRFWITRLVCPQISLPTSWTGDVAWRSRVFVMQGCWRLILYPNPRKSYIIYIHIHVYIIMIDMILYTYIYRYYM